MSDHEKLVQGAHDDPAPAPVVPVQGGDQNVEVNVPPAAPSTPAPSSPSEGGGDKSGS